MIFLLNSESKWFCTIGKLQIVPLCADSSVVRKKLLILQLILTFPLLIVKHGMKKSEQSMCQNTWSIQIILPAFQLEYENLTLCEKIKNLTGFPSFCIIQD